MKKSQVYYSDICRKGTHQLSQGIIPDKQMGQMLGLVRMERLLRSSSTKG